MILEIAELKSTALWWLIEIRRTGFVIYWLVILLFFSGLFSLFLIHVDLSVRANGIIISLNERKDTKSTESGFVGECYVPSKDIGFIQKGQEARLQIDAFDYNYFGVIESSIYSIDDDFFLLDKTPVFKVRCRLNEKILKLTNGYTVELKKGLSFQARFITCNRSLWQLLFERLTDWFDPSRRPILKSL